MKFLRVPQSRARLNWSRFVRLYIFVVLGILSLVVLGYSAIFSDHRVLLGIGILAGALVAAGLVVWFLRLPARPGDRVRDLPRLWWNYKKSSK